MHEFDLWLGNGDPAKCMEKKENRQNPKDSRPQSCLPFSESHLTSNHEEQIVEERIPFPSTVSQGTGEFTGSYLGKKLFLTPVVQTFFLIWL